MKRVLYIILIFISMACSKTSAVLDDGPMMMNAVTKSSVDFGSGTPVFLFWLEDDFNNISETIYTQPYLVSWPIFAVDEYKVTPYNTGKKYPDEGVVCCTGYFPASLIVDDGAEKKSWTSLDVPVDDIGILDVMVVQNHITGESTQHFETKNPKEPLEFYHAQSKIVFKAKMGSEMATNRYLRNIKITVPGTELMSGLVWRDGRYIANETAGDDLRVILKDPSSTQLDPNQMVREIGNIYIYPDKSSLMMKVEVEMSDSPLFTESEIISMETEVVFNLTDGKGDVLKENEAYELILVINYDSIVLQGRKADWQDGGKIMLPIYPNSNKE